MHRVTVVVVVAALVLASTAAFAQMDEDYSAFRAKLGVMELGEADVEFGLGVDYEASNWMLSLDWMEAESGPVTEEVWGLNASYLLRQDENPGTYYGAGVGYYQYDVSAPGGSADDGSIGFEVLGGLSFGEADAGQLPPWFAEFRYLLGTDFEIDDTGGDIDGWKLFIGRRF